jgi:septal ring factor EnvC (AmiA/AmiB activator)
MAITEQDVHIAADALLQAGERPTIERVRLKLGRGSPNTITGFLNSWFQVLGTRLHHREASTSCVPETVLQTATQLWEKSLEQAFTEINSQLSLERTHLQEARAALAVQQEQLTTTTQHLARREADLEHGLVALREQLASTQAQLQGVTGQREEAVRAGELARQETAAVRAEHEALQTQLIALQAAHTQNATQAQERHAAQERRWLTELDRERQQVKRLHAEITQIRQDATHQHTQAQTLLTENQEAVRRAEQRASALQGERDTLCVALDAQRKAHEALLREAEQRAGEHAGHLHDLRAQMRVKERQLRVLTQKTRAKRRVRHFVPTLSQGE